MFLISARCTTPLPGRNFFANRPLLGAVLISAALQLAVLLIPAAAAIFRVIPLDAKAWFIVTVLSLSPLFIGEHVEIGTWLDNYQV